MNWKTLLLSRSLSVPVSSWTPFPIILLANHMHTPHQSPVATYSLAHYLDYKGLTHTPPHCEVLICPGDRRFLVDCFLVSVGLFILCDSLLPALILACVLDCVCLPPALISACDSILFACCLPRPLPVLVYVPAFAPVYLCKYCS